MVEGIKTLDLSIIVLRKQRYRVNHYTLYQLVLIAVIKSRIEIGLPMFM